MSSDFVAFAASVTAANPTKPLALVEPANKFGRMAPLFDLLGVMAQNSNPLFAAKSKSFTIAALPGVAALRLARHHLVVVATRVAKLHIQSVLDCLGMGRGVAGGRPAPPTARGLLEIPGIDDLFHVL